MRNRRARGVRRECPWCVRALFSLIHRSGCKRYYKLMCSCFIQETRNLNRAHILAFGELGEQNQAGHQHNRDGRPSLLGKGLLNNFERLCDDGQVLLHFLLC